MSSGAFGTFDGIFEQAISWIKQFFCSGRVVVGNFSLARRIKILRFSFLFKCEMNCALVPLRFAMDYYRENFEIDERIWGFFDSGMRYLYEFGKSVERRRLSLKGIVSWIFLLFFVKFLESRLKYAYESSHS